MKTYFSDLIPKLQRYSKRLDDLTILQNQHWVLFEEIPAVKSVFIFRSNKQLLISKNGKVEKAEWDLIDSNTILIERSEESYLLKHGFIDDNILAVNLDGTNSFAFFVNQNKADEALDSLDSICRFLTKKYMEDTPRFQSTRMVWISFSTDKGPVYFELKNQYDNPTKGTKAYIDDRPAPTGRYKLGFLWYVHVEEGLVTEVGFC